MALGDDKVNDFFNLCETKVKNLHEKIAKGSSKGTNPTAKANSIFVKSEEFNEDALNIKDVEITYRLLMSDAPAGEILTAGLHERGFVSSSYYQMDTLDGDIELTLNAASFISLDAGFIIYQDTTENFDVNPLIVVLGNRTDTEFGPQGDEFIKGTTVSTITVTKKGAMGAFVRIPGETNASWLHIEDLAQPRQRFGYSKHIENALGSVWINADGSIEMYGNAAPSSIKRQWPISLDGTGYKLRSFICSGVPKPTEIGRVVPAITDENYSGIIDSVENKTVATYPWPTMATPNNFMAKKFDNKILMLGYPSSGATGYFIVTDLDFNVISYATTSFYGDTYTTATQKQLLDVTETTQGVYKVAVLFGLLTTAKIGFITITGNVAGTPTLMTLPHGITVAVNKPGAHILNYTNTAGSLAGGFYRVDSDTASLVFVEDADFETFKTTHTASYTYGTSDDARLFRRSVVLTTDDLWFIENGIPVSYASEFSKYSAYGYYANRFRINRNNDLMFNVGDHWFKAGAFGDSSDAIKPLIIDQTDGCRLLLEPFYNLSYTATVEYKLTKFFPDGHSEVSEFFQVDNGLLFNVDGIDGAFGFKGSGSDYTITKVIANNQSSDETRISWKSFWTKDYT